MGTPDRLLAVERIITDNQFAHPRQRAQRVDDYYASILRTDRDALETLRQRVRTTPTVGFDGDVGGVIVNVTEHWVVAVVPMIFNDRITLSTREEWRIGWTAGYCYDKGGAAALAALAWDPETEEHPVGWKKIAGDARLAPEG